MYKITPNLVNMKDHIKENDNQDAIISDTKVDTEEYTEEDTERKDDRIIYVRNIVHIYEIVTCWYSICKNIFDLSKILISEESIVPNMYIIRNTNFHFTYLLRWTILYDTISMEKHKHLLTCIQNTMVYIIFYIKALVPDPHIIMITFLERICSAEPEQTFKLSQLTNQLKKNFTSEYIFNDIKYQLVKLMSYLCEKIYTINTEILFMLPRRFNEICVKNKEFEKFKPSKLFIKHFNDLHIIQKKKNKIVNERKKESHIIYKKMNCEFHKDADYKYIFKISETLYAYSMNLCDTHKTIIDIIGNIVK